jgi:hypothetical protein
MKRLKLCVLDKKGITHRTYHIDFDETEGDFLDLRVADYNFILTKEGKPITEFIKIESNENN